MKKVYIKNLSNVECIRAALANKKIILIAPDCKDGSNWVAGPYRARKWLVHVFVENNIVTKLLEN